MIDKKGDLLGVLKVENKLPDTIEKFSEHDEALCKGFIRLAEYRPFCGHHRLGGEARRGGPQGHKAPSFPTPTGLYTSGDS